MTCFHNWPVEKSFTKLDPAHPYSQRSKELTVQNDCILWESRVVMPEVRRGKVMEILHDGHPGMTRMKAIAQGIVWWPGIDAEL